jgi:hypothetical protein
MKKPKRRSRSLATTLLASAFLLFAGCSRAGLKCPDDPSRAALGITPAFLPDKPVRERLSLTWRKGVLMVNAEGDIFFVPPDTLRMEIRSDWGETLFDLRIAGKGVAWSPEPRPGDSADIQRVLQGLSAEALLHFLAGRPGLSSIAGLAPAASLQWFCAGGEVIALATGCRIALSPDQRNLRRIEFTNMGLTFEILGVELWRGEQLPGRFRIRSNAAGTLDISISGRSSGAPISGGSILK